MTTESDKPEVDNEVPPVARVFGLAVSEWVTYSLIAVTVIAAIFGSMVGSERDAQAERAIATLDALTKAAENKAAAGTDLVCDDTLLEPEQLANDYLSLSIRPAPIDEDDKSAGYGPALYVSVVEKEVSGDTWDTAQRLMDLVKAAGRQEPEASGDRSGRAIAASIVSGEVVPGEDEVAEAEEKKKPENRLREVRKRSYGEDEEYLRYYVLASEVVACGQND